MQPNLCSTHLTDRMPWNSQLFFRIFLTQPRPLSLFLTQYFTKPNTSGNRRTCLSANLIVGKRDAYPCQKCSYTFTGCSIFRFFLTCGSFEVLFSHTALAFLLVLGSWGTLGGLGRKLRLGSGRKLVLDRYEMCPDKSFHMISGGTGLGTSFCQG